MDVGSDRAWIDDRVQTCHYDGAIVPQEKVVGGIGAKRRYISGFADSGTTIRDR